MRRVPGRVAAGAGHGAGAAAGESDEWFAEDAPDPETLARARADFGPMILTQVQYDEAKKIRVEEHLRRTKLED